MGDHFAHRNDAQKLANHIGKIVRLRPDGTVPPDNPSWGVRARSPKSGATATAMRRAPPSIRNPASYGSTSMARAAATRSTLWRRARIMAGLIGYGIDYSGAKIHKARTRPAWSSRSNIGCPRSRPPGWRSMRANCSRLGAAACSSARWPARFCASRRTRRHGRQRGAAAAIAQRAYPRRARPPGWRVVACHGRFVGAGSAGCAGEMTAAFSQASVNATSATSAAARIALAKFVNPLLQIGLR